MKIFSQFGLLGILISLQLAAAQDGQMEKSGKRRDAQMSTTILPPETKIKINRNDIMPRTQYIFPTTEGIQYYPNAKSLPKQNGPRKESKLVYGILNSKNDLKILNYEYLKPIRGGTPLKPRTAPQLTYRPKPSLAHRQAKPVAKQASPLQQPPESKGSILEKTLSDLLDKNLQEAKELLRKVNQVTHTDAQQQQHGEQYAQGQMLDLANILGRPYGYAFQSGVPLYTYPNQLVTSYSQPLDVDDFDLYDEFDSSNWDMDNQIRGDKNLGFEGGREVDINHRMSDIFQELLAGGVGTPVAGNMSSLKNSTNVTAFEQLFSSNNLSDYGLMHPDPEDILKRHNWTAKHFMRREEFYSESNDQVPEYYDNANNRMALEEAEDEETFLEPENLERESSSDEDNNSEKMLQFCRKGLSNVISNDKYLEQKDDRKENTSTKE